MANTTIARKVRSNVSPSHDYRHCGNQHLFKMVVGTSRVVTRTTSVSRLNGIPYVVASIQKFLLNTASRRAQNLAVISSSMEARCPRLHHSITIMMNTVKSPSSKNDGSIIYCKFSISVQHANYMEVRDLVDGAAHGQVSRDILPALCAGLYRTRVYVSFGFQKSGHSKS